MLVILVMLVAGRAGHAGHAGHACHTGHAGHAGHAKTNFSTIVVEAVLRLWLLLQNHVKNS